MYFQTYRDNYAKNYRKENKNREVYMNIFSIFTLLGGLAFFIFGMNQMSDSLEKIAGKRMEAIINKMTQNRFAGLLMGCIITIAIQSSSAVTVMLVGLVNSGLMNISNTVGVIMGSNIGTTITAWIMSLIGVSSDNVFIKMLKPESFSPLLAFIGIGLIMLSKKSKQKEIGNSFLGFAILMYGMVLMSGSVAPLADSPAFIKILTAFQNPLLGVLTGLVVTALIQSSAASLGMLQALSLTGGITYGMAIPIIMGQNIGTCATAILSSIGVSKNAKRVAVIHLSFNLIGTAFFMILYFVVHSIFDLPFVDTPIDPMGIALCHSIFNIATTAFLLPFTKQLVAIATRTIKTEPEVQVAFLDERLFETPSVAVAECNKLSLEMAELTGDSIKKAIHNLFTPTEEEGAEIVKLEDTIDIYEDHLGSYLVKLSGKSLSMRDSRVVSKVLHTIGDFERISDHARNLVASAREMAEKDLQMSDQAMQELETLNQAILDITDITIRSYINMDVSLAEKVEPLEQVIDLMTDTIHLHHTDRLQTGDCTIERGFVLADILNNCERISDHCSNIAVAVLEADRDVYDPHEYLRHVKDMENPDFMKLFNGYKEKYLTF